MQNRIFETTGILSQPRSILFDCDGIWKKFHCNNVVTDAGFQIIYINDEMELRFEHEKILVKGGSDIQILFLINRQEMYVPIDIKRHYYVAMLTYDSLFPQLSSDALRTMPGIDFDMLSANISKAPFGIMDFDQTVEWCRNSMYQAEYCLDYAMHILDQAKELAKSASSHRDWDKVAKLYGKAAMIHHSGVVLPNWHDLRKTIEDSFVIWIEKKYKLLSGSVDRKRPILLSKVADFIRRASSKVALVVMDGMSFENLYTIQREIVDSSIVFEIDSSFSFFPTVTSVARQSIFSGKLPREHLKPFSSDNEEKLWTSFWKDSGLCENEIAFYKGLIDDVPNTTKAVGIVVNIVDALMHAELQGHIGIQHGLCNWVRNGQLIRMIQMLIDNGFTVYMTSDHGNTSAIGSGRFTKPGLLAEPASRRAVIYNSSFDARELDKFDVIRYSGTYLPDGYDAYLFNAGTCYGDLNKEYVTHGGMTIEESIVPFVRIGDYNG